MQDANSEDRAGSYAQAGGALLQNFLNLFPTGSEAGRIWQSLLSGHSADPSRLAALQTGYFQQQLALWGGMLARESGQAAEPAATAGKDAENDKASKDKAGKDEAGSRDKRFSGREWRDSHYHDYLRQAYLLNSRFLNDLVEAAQLDEPAKQRLRFYTRQLIDAMSPANYAATNPEALQLALATKGESLHAGIRQLIEDVEKGRVSMTEESAFEVGGNLAVTPGAVVFENALIQLIQYKPTTAKVRKRPLLMVPPCINKFYILDLQPENSFVRYAVEQGNTVFMLSWRNIIEEGSDGAIEEGNDRVIKKGRDGENLGGLDWDNYIADGVLKAIEVVRAISKSGEINALGFCVGGTLLASALAVLRARGEARVASVTLLATMLDFADPGDLGVFIDEASMAAREAAIGKGGIFSGKDLAFVFSALRANDLVWSYVVNNYLKGKTPAAFDILYWNADSTNLPGPMYCWYVRNMYLENKLRESGRLDMCGVPVDLGAIRLPTYILATREDHIVPWKSAYLSTTHLMGHPKGDTRSDAQCDTQFDAKDDTRIDAKGDTRSEAQCDTRFDAKDDTRSEATGDMRSEATGDMRFVLGASGHVAGVINPPAKTRRSYWTNERIAPTAQARLAGATETRGDAEAWLAGATETRGSWWPDWNVWLEKYSSGERAAPKKLGNAKYKPIEPAPGRFVKVRV